MILLAYFLLANNKLDADDIKYIMLNFSGAILACIASLLMAYYPFVFLEATWAAIYFITLLKYRK